MRVLLLSPSTFGYEARIREAFERVGHDVVWMDERVGNDVMSKTITRLGLLRAIPGAVRGRVYKIIARAQSFKADALIVINPETMRGGDFATIREALPNVQIVVYRWDSLAQKPIDDQTFAAANAVYSFDPVDCESDIRLRHLPLFHSHNEPPKPRSIVNKTFDFCFVGTAQPRRIRTLGRLCAMLEAEGRPYLFFLKTQSPLHHLYFRVYAYLHGYCGILSRQSMPYEQVLAVIEDSAVTLDIEFGRQSGLTMRTLEVAFSGVPLLTTNRSVERYDFFSERPILIFDEEGGGLPDTTGLGERSGTAYFKKYHIETWARTIMSLATEQYFSVAESTATNVEAGKTSGAMNEGRGEQ